MNIKITDSWLREALETSADSATIQKLVSLSGPSIERLDKKEGELIYDIEITTNRVDAASVYGFAREACTILERHSIPAKLAPLSVFQLDKDLSPEIDIEDKSKLTRRILAVVIEDVNVMESSAKIKKRLGLAGIRSLNNLIDITNYVMLEVGHPLHVFDLARIKTGKLVIRQAKDGEMLITLDGKKSKLTAKDVVIDDGTGRIIDLPGIMGCENSVVTNETRKILLFAEVNDPVRIRKTSMRLGIRTLAASYNENAPDQELAQTAVLRAVKLYQELTGGKVKGGLIDVHYEPEPTQEVYATLSDFEKYMGVKITQTEVRNILESLGFQSNGASGNKLGFKVPSTRLRDIKSKEDLIEEVARIYGYDRLGSNLPPFSYVTDEYIRHCEQDYQVEKRLKYLLSDLGFFELYNYSMISERENQLFSLPKSAICMVNPMSEDLVYFRQSLVPSLVKDAGINKVATNLKIFELANVYLPRTGDLPEEKRMLTMLIKGDFFKLKGLVESIFSMGNISLKFEPTNKYPYLEPSESVAILVKDRIVGYLGTLSKKTTHALQLKSEYVVAEIAFEAFAANFMFQRPISEAKAREIYIEDITYEFKEGKSWENTTSALKAAFPQIVKLEFLSQYENYFTLRIYTASTSGSILNQMTAYLESQLKLKLKRSKDDNSKS